MLSLLAGLIAYAGLTIAFTLVCSNGDAKSAAIGSAYLAGAFGAPIAGGVYLTRYLGWSRLRAIRFAATISLLVHTALLPVALAALAM